MSPRERWIVYPLIFLTLGIALRDKLLYRIKTNEVRAQRVICDELLAERLLVNRSTRMNQIECRTLVVQGTNGNPIAVVGADAATNNGLIETFSSHGVPQIRLQSNEGSGVVTAFDQSGKMVTLGCVGKRPGVFVYLPDQKVLVPVTLQVEFKPNGKAAQPKDAKQPAEE
jgi:hypothetical protein